jgi:hypothetical protein
VNVEQPTSKENHRLRDSTSPQFHAVLEGHVVVLTITRMLSDENEQGFHLRGFELEKREEFL